MANANVRRHLSEAALWQAGSMVEQGARHPEVAEVFGVDHTVINRAWARFQQHGSPVRRHGGGRTRVTFEAQHPGKVVCW
jgi:transposase